MMKYFIIIATYLLPLIALAQQQQAAEAIKFFLQQDTAEKGMYEVAVKKLEVAAANAPNNANYQYYLGYAYDRLNSPHAEFIPGTQLPLTVKASAALEKAIAIAPHSEMDIYKSDPYTKLSAVWGSLAFAYWHRQLPDSAIWALHQGKQRGGFLSPVLAYAREMLMNTDTNAILIGVGDNFTFPLHYVQKVEGFRKDVAVIDANLLGTSWYASILLQHPSLMSLSATELALIDYKPWEDQTIVLSSGNDSFSWTMKPTYFGQYVLRSDRILLELLQQQWNKRPFYFVNPVDSSYSLFLEVHMESEGILSRLNIGAAKLPPEWSGYAYNFLSRYTVSAADKVFFQKSPDAIRLVNGYRYAYVSKLAILLREGQRDEAKKLFAQMRNNLPVSILPFDTEDLATYMDQLEAYFNE